MRARDSISAAEARRIALGAQGFARSRPAGRVDRRHLRRAFADMGVIQIDSVNVLVRSQELPLFARLGPHPRRLIPAATADGELYEYWVHEACHVPTADRHLYAWRHESPVMWKSLERFQRERPGFLDRVEEFVADNGPVVAGDLRQRRGPKGSWWDWDDGKVALEVLFHCGRVVATRREGDFARLYDLPERVLPRDVLDRPALPEREARKELLVRAARHHGVGTLADLADYHRQLPTVCAPLVAELVEDGRLRAVEVEGWSRPAFVHAATKLPRRIGARALLSPFDPVVWNRDRAERLFGFRYRIEIYVPKPKRQYGYFVLPFLLGDDLVGRVDLKADRERSTLLVHHVWGEPAIDETDVAAEMVSELVALAEWLGLDHVQSTGQGDLAAPLGSALAAHSMGITRRHP